MRVLELKRRNTSNAAELVKVIASDSALAAKVLGLANSSAFAPASPVTRLSTAIGMIGLNNLLPLVFGLSLGGIFNKLGLTPADQSSLWRASLLKSVAARACARRLGATEAQIEEIQLAALLQDVALPMFHAADRSAWPEYLAVLECPDGERTARECAMFGVDHGDVGARCLRSLGLPESFAALATVHHQPGAPTPATPIADAVPAVVLTATRAAATLPHKLPAFNAKLLQPFALRLGRMGKFEAADMTLLLTTICKEFGALTENFAEQADGGASYKQFLQQLSEEVAGCLQSAIGSSTSEINGLKERERQLATELFTLAERAQQAEADSLTKVLTRAAFLPRLDKMLSLAHVHGAACAVGFLDVDDFKHVNDTYGHAAGDAALVELAAVAAAGLKGRGIVGRIGGDEFVFAFIARPEAMDADIDAFTAQVTRVSIQHEHQQMEVSTSVGVLRLGVPAAETDPAAVLKEADALMYAAKRGGKGRAAIGGRSQLPPVPTPAAA